MITSDMSDGAASVVVLENFGKLIGFLFTGLVKLIIHFVRKYKQDR